MHNSIKEIIGKIKHFYTGIPLEILFSIVIILVGFTAFGLGRLSILSETSVQAVLRYNSELSNEPLINIKGKVVASKNGKKYHYPWCGGAVKMSEQNKRWYNTAEDARKDGYTPAGNCKGLE